MPPQARLAWTGGGNVPKKRPGVILYFDTKPAMKRLNKEQKGELLDAILEYGEFGTFPDFNKDPYLQLAWDFIYPRIDKDGESYQKTVSNNLYGTYCREAKKKGVEPVSFDFWENLSPDAQRKFYESLSNAIGR